MSYPRLEFQSHIYNMHHRARSGQGIATVLSQKAIKADFARNENIGFNAIAYPFGDLPGNLKSVVRAIGPS